MVEVILHQFQQVVVQAAAVVVDKTRRQDWRTKAIVAAELVMETMEERAEQ